DLDWSKLKVLFAEDNATISLLTNKMLTTKGVTVVSGMDGQKALDKFDIDSINVVLTDIFMPNMDGYALTKELRSRGFKGPVIGVSAAVVGEETELLLAAGADAVLSKPIKLSELETELKRLAERIN
ncbi:MAG: response regulator, partial [Oceanospirillaceae bacterium]|nr:response regulator [Oceanospirillaceae bacterium]